MKRDSCRRRPRLRLAAAIAALSLSVACGDVADMAFAQDHRVSFLEPADRSIVKSPVKLRWDVNGFTVTGRDGRGDRNAGYFAVFLDQPPVPPGESLAWLTKDESSCVDEGCVDDEFLADRFVYVSEKTTLTLSRLPDIPESGGYERHEAVLVLLDGTGKRIGESAFYVRFNVKREGSP